VAPVAKARWRAICGQCAGGIDSLVELLQGRFSKGVMEHLCTEGTGLFPTPAEITFTCSCPDWASMCKHVAAVLYGVGARLDLRPELLFRLRQVDERELIASAGSGVPLSRKGPAAGKVLADGDLADVFGVELVSAAPAVAARKPSGAGSHQLDAVSDPAATALRPRRKRSAGAVASAAATAARPAKASKKRVRTGKPPSLGVTKSPIADKPPLARRRTMTSAEREAVSERMRRYWADRRKG